MHLFCKLTMFYSLCIFVNKTMFRLFLSWVLMMNFAMAQPVVTEKVLSPDGNICVSFWVRDGKPYYSVVYGGKTLLDSSSMGFEFKDKTAIDSNLTWYDVSRSSNDETWKPVWGTSSSVRNNFNASVFYLKETNATNRRLDIEFRVYNDGVAFRYIFPKKTNDSLLITAENTEFRFARNDSAWWIPSDEFAYESLYRNTPLSEIHDANTPLTVVTAGYCISIHEAALLDYSEMVLMRDQSDPLLFHSHLWPWPDGVCVRAKAPFTTPWRTIMITRNAGQLMESHLIQNLNEPCTIKDVSWIKPMKFAGIWWGMHTGKYTWYAGPAHGATTERAKYYIDFCASHGIGGFLAEGWNQGWETWASDSLPVQDFCQAYPDFDLAGVVRYAKKRKIEFISHHETGGNIPMYESQLDAALKLCRDLGIRSLKTGYAGTITPAGMPHHGQFMVRHFQKVVESAARFHITINAHESIKPTGLDRTWPNLMSQEAARGNEWNATYRAIPPYYATILPFTRFLAGPYDYTPGIFNINYAPEKNKRLYCTLAGELSLYIIFFSPLMMVADMPENYEGQPAFRFIEDVPCSWDETKVLAARPGDWLCVARRNGNNWFVGARTDENEALLRIPMNFLPEEKSFTASVYADASGTDWEFNPQEIEIGTYKVSHNDTLLIPLSKAGGFVMSVKPFDSIEDDTLARPISVFNASAPEKMQHFAKLKTYGDMRIGHAGVGSVVQHRIPYSAKYPASGTNALCDGITGSLNFSDGGWQGFEGTGLEAVIEFPSETSISSITAHFLYSPNDWLFLPEKVEILVSADGKNFEPLSRFDIPNERPTDMKIMEIKTLSDSFEPIDVRYIKVVATSAGICPDWHYARGKKSWIFVDEIILK